MTCSTSYCLVTLKDLWNVCMYVLHNIQKSKYLQSCSSVTYYSSTHLHSQPHLRCLISSIMTETYRIICTNKWVCLCKYCTSKFLIVHNFLLSSSLICNYSFKFVRAPHINVIFSVQCYSQCK
jgi:hypothetical protein